MKNILVPIDFSEKAVSAKNKALNLASGTDSVIHFFHVYNSSTCTPKQVEQRMEEIMLFQKEANNQGTKSEIHMVDVHLFEEKVYKAIVKYVEENNIDLIMMGSNGADNVEQYIWGSNAQRIIREATCPVIVVKEDSPVFTVKNLVVVMDFKDEKVNQNLDKLFELKKFFNSNLYFLYVNTPVNFESSKSTLDRCQKYLQSYPQNDFKIIIYNHFSFEDGVVDYTESLKDVLVVLTTHGNKGFKRWFFQNHAESIVNYSKHPVLSYNLNKQ